MLITSEDMLKYAREFAFSIDGENIRVTRYTNHGYLWEGEGWAVCWKGEMYLQSDNHYYYKYAASFRSAEDAFSAALRAGKPRVLLNQEEGLRRLKARNESITMT